MAIDCLNDRWMSVDEGHRLQHSRDLSDRIVARSIEGRSQATIARVTGIFDGHRLDARLEGEGQRLVGRLVVAGLWVVEEGRVALRGQILDAWLGLEPGERVAGWREDAGMCVLPGDVGRVTTARNWSVDTSRSGSYSGISILTACPAGLDGDAGDRVLRLGWTRDESGVVRVRAGDAMAAR